MKKFLLLPLLFLLSFPAQAQSPGDLNLQISPVPVTLSVKPGETASAELRIKNAGAETERLKVSLFKFRPEGEEGRATLLEREPGDDYFDWVSFSRETVTAPPGEWQRVGMTIRVPEEAAFGYYYAVQFAREEPGRPEGGRSVVEGAVVIFVLLEVEVPGAKREAEVISFAADRKFYEFLPATFSVTVKNTGNLHLAPRGNIFIRRSRGEKDLAALVLNETGGYALPESNRIYRVSWEDGFPIYRTRMEDGVPARNEAGTPERELVWDTDKPLSKLRFGRYTARLLLIYDDGTRDVPTQGEVSFWVVPWRLVAGGAVILGLLFFFAYKYWRTRRQLKQYLEGAQ